MTPSEYIPLAFRTCSPAFNPAALGADLTHAILGLVTESGELADHLKKATFYGRGGPSDLELIEELGDILWYVALACRALGVSFETVMEKNIAKLKTRYPDKFTPKDSLYRDLDAERAAMESPNDPR